MNHWKGIITPKDPIRSGKEPMEWTIDAAWYEWYHQRNPSHTCTNSSFLL